MSQNRKVKSARLHNAITIVGYGQLGGTVVVAPHERKIDGKPGIDVTKTEDGLLITGLKGEFEVLVPFANVAMMVLEPEKKAEDKK